jgi:ABC-type multidrug transport system fused ATPase/permease subunit
VPTAVDPCVVSEWTICVWSNPGSTIKNADKILLVQEGRIVEEGAHSDLIKKEGGAYAQLVGKQIESFDTPSPT